MIDPPVNVESADFEMKTREMSAVDLEALGLSPEGQTLPFQRISSPRLSQPRIDKTVEGIYFICVSCKKVCHNLDEGLVEDPDNARNICLPCSSSGSGGQSKGRAA